MVSQNQSPAAEAARTIASELNQPTRGKGVDRLAADLGDGPHNHPWLNPLPEPVVSKHPEETPMRMALIELQARTGAKSVKIDVSLKEDMRIEWWVIARFERSSESICRHADTLAGVLLAVQSDFDKNAAERARKAKIEALAEKMIAEQEAAEKAEQSTAPLAFRPDGSPADTLPLPVEPFDGVTPADGGGVAVGETDCVPIGKCPKCGADQYTTFGFCGGCRP